MIDITELNLNPETCDSVRKKPQVFRAVKSPDSPEYVIITSNSGGQRSIHKNIFFDRFVSHNENGQTYYGLRPEPLLAMNLESQCYLHREDPETGVIKIIRGSSGDKVVMSKSSHINQIVKADEFISEYISEEEFSNNYNDLNNNLENNNEVLNTWQM